MRLVSFSVENYRSITKARKIPLEDYTVLVGANNEGKSNILAALSLGMRALSNYRDSGVSRPLAKMPSRLVDYDWEIDFPIGKQVQKSKKETRVTLEFDLSDEEKVEFKSKTGSSINGALSIILNIGEREYDISIVKPGRGHAPYNRNKYKIAKFIASKLKFEYIPAIRTANAAQRVIADLVDGELAKLERNTEYMNALDSIEKLQLPILASIAKSVSDSTRMFLPNVKRVEIKPIVDKYRSIRRNIEVFVDDGERTRLQRKGDGVQSLVALGVMRYASNANAATSSAIFAIEEPEAHLHPDAVHAIRAVLGSLSTTNQIVVSSHSPLFVNRSNLKSNIIVQRSEARTAKNIADIRKVLGVRLSDNLQNASLVLLVEGPDDQRSLVAILSQRSEAIREAIAHGRLIMDPLLGASGLSQKASFYAAGACSVHVFLDSDQAGKEAGKKAIDFKVIDSNCINYSSVVGMAEAELEDLHDKSLYAADFKSKFEVDVTIKLPGKAMKFSNQMEKLFIFSGKQWDESVKMSVKDWLAAFAVKNAHEVISGYRSGPIDALVGSIEMKLGKPE